MPSKKQQTPAAANADTSAPATDAAPAAPTAPPPEPRPPDVPVLAADFTDLGRVRALPETPAGQVLRLGPVAFAPGSIEQFADEDGRTMRVVNINGIPHKYPVPEVPAEPTEEGA